MASAQPNGQGEYPVQLYVYDLSKGMARALSAQLTGRQFDAIYHTSIVVHGREWYFGQGIHNAPPGRTHFGSPIERLDLGTTSIDAETFKELLQDLAERFTAQAYHLLNFNCNTFTNEVANVLVGRDIPAHITSLPSDFMATPFGAMMRPHIESMFRTSGPQEQQVDAPPPGAVARSPNASALLNNIAQQAYSGPSSSRAALNSSAGVEEIHSVTDFDTLRSSEQCAVVLFTSQNCPPCVQLRPAYESLAEQYGRGDASRQRPIAFGRVESTSQTAQVMSQQRISATPTIRFYLDGDMMKEVKGANPHALKDGIEELLWHRYRPHPHSKLESPVSLVPAQPIVFRSIPNLMTAQQKLDEMISKHKAANFAEKADLQDARGVLTRVLIPWIKSGPALGKSKAMSQDEVRQWATSAAKCINVLAPAAVFPIIDLLRIAMLDSQQAIALTQSNSGHVLSAATAKAKAGMTQVAECKATLLTTYRLASNILALQSHDVAHKMNADGDLIALLVFGVLCDDVSVRAAAINAAFNLAKALAAARGTFEKAASTDKAPNADLIGVDEQVEVLCAVLECIEKEDDLERLHRAAATCSLFLYCAPEWSISIQPMLEVVEAATKLQSKADWVANKAKTDAKAEDKGKLEDVRRLLSVSAKLAAASG